MTSVTNSASQPVRRPVLVTGGTSGIGRAMALAFAAQEDRVLAAGLPPFGELPPAIETAELDVTDPASIDRVIRTLGRLDVLVCTAGTIRRRDEFTVAVFEEVV